jgi:hypothetical protein
VTGKPLFSIEGTISVAHFAAQKALVATWISMTSGRFQEALAKGLNECGRVGAVTWIVDLTQNPGVPSQADLGWIEGPECMGLCQRNQVRAVINIHGKSAVATMGAKRWSKSASSNGMSTYDCSTLADALALAADVASGKAA